MSSSVFGVRRLCRSSADDVDVRGEKRLTAAWTEPATETPEGLRQAIEGIPSSYVFHVLRWKGSTLIDIAGLSFDMNELELARMLIFIHLV